MTDVEKLVEVITLGNELMVKHGLTEQGWRFDLDNGKQRIGCCHHGKKLITYSSHYIDETSMEEIEDTILHEIAHALCGSGHGHDWYWKAKCVEIGARPERLKDEVKAVSSVKKYNYKIQCNNCGRSWKRYRLKRQYLIQGAFQSGCCGASMTVWKIK